MGRRGPAPLPTRIKLLHGETRPSRLNLDEPRPATNAPVMPADLDPAAQVVGSGCCEIRHQGVILAAHADVLRLYCEAVVRYGEASALLGKSGLLLRGARGSEVVRNPLVAMVRDTGEQVRVLARELGLTPSSLSGVQAFQTPDQEAMASRRRII